MIAGVGVDIIEIERVTKACDRPGFIKKVFTANELLGSRRAESLAGVFCAKEAVAKALGTGFRAFSPRDIEVVKDDLGRPCVKLHGKSAETARILGVSRIHISISHNKTTATAFAVAERE